jgi:CheY-specific phosphatase CheX
MILEPPEPPIPELDSIIASALAEVLTTQFKLSVIASAPADKPNANQNEQCLVGSVKLTGGLFSGDVQLQLPEAFVAKLTTVLLGPNAASVTSEDSADITGELCNMLAGRIAATLAAAGYSSILSIPIVARGRRLEFENAPGAKTYWTNWTCEGHLLKVASQFSFRSR